MPNLPNIAYGRNKAPGELGVHPTTFLEIDSIRMHWQAGDVLPHNHHPMPNYFAVQVVLDNPQKHDELLQIIRLSEDDTVVPFVEHPLKALEIEIPSKENVIDSKTYDADWWKKKAVAICLFPDQGLPNSFTTLLWPGKDLTLKSADLSSGNKPDLVVKSVEVSEKDGKTHLAIRLLNQGATTNKASTTAIIRVGANHSVRLLGSVATPALAHNESRTIHHDIEPLTQDCRLVFLANAPQPGHPWGALTEFGPLNTTSETLELALPTFSNNAFAIRFHAEPGEKAFQNSNVH